MGVGCRHACCVMDVVMGCIFESRELSEAEFSGQLRSTKLSLYISLSLSLYSSYSFPDFVAR